LYYRDDIDDIPAVLFISANCTDKHPKHFFFFRIRTFRSARKREDDAAGRARSLKSDEYQYEYYYEYCRKMNSAMLVVLHLQAARARVPLSAAPLTLKSCGET